MKNHTLIVFVLLFMIQKGFSQELFSRTDHFQFYRQDNRDYSAYIAAFSEAYRELIDLFSLEPNHLIKVIIFSTQRDFIEKIYGYYESGVTSVAMAVSGEDTIYITSYHDHTTGRDFNEYRKVAKHELVHTLLNNESAWLSEGLALYCANQIREFDTLPMSQQEMSEYLECNFYFREAYAYYSWFSRYIIQKAGFEKYLEFFKSDLNWSIIGWSNRDDFCEDAFNALISSSVGD